MENKHCKTLDVGSDCVCLGDLNLDIRRGLPTDLRWDLNKLPLPFRNKQFRKVYCYHTLEHLDKPERVLDELLRISKVVEVKVPHRNGTVAKADRSHKHFFDMKWFEAYAKSRGIKCGGYVGIDLRRFNPIKPRLIFPLEITVWLWQIV